MDKIEAQIVAHIIQNGGCLEDSDNVRDMCEALTEANLGFNFIFNEVTGDVVVTEK